MTQDEHEHDRKMYNLWFDALERGTRYSWHDRIQLNDHLHRAIQHNRLKCVEIILDELKVPANLSLKDRIALHMLTEDSTF